MALNFTAFDIETASATWDTICAISLVHVRDGVVSDSFYTLINPECEFDPMNVRIHGITQADVTDAPTLPMVRDRIIDFIGEDVLVSHNIVFDANSLHKAFLRYGLDIPPIKTFCTLACSRVCRPDLADHKLNTLCKDYGISLLHHHNANDDAIACANLMLAIARQLEADDLDGVSLLLQLNYGSIDQIQVKSPYSCFAQTKSNRAANPYNILLDLKDATPDLANEITMDYLKDGKRIVFKCADSVLFYYSVSAYPFIRISDIEDGKQYSYSASRYKDGAWKIPVSSLCEYSKFISTVSDFCKDKFNKTASVIFGCCNDFIRCSDELKCLKSENPDYRGCLYRKNLESGRIFYGKNKNI